jgi:hypothetical protein
MRRRRVRSVSLAAPAHSGIDFTPDCIHILNSTRSAAVHSTTTPRAQGPKLHDPAGRSVRVGCVQCMICHCITNACVFVCAGYTA